MSSRPGAEAEAVRRAKDGSDTLLIFLLKSRRPEVYVERHRHRIETKSQPGGLPWIDREEVERLRRIAFQTWGDQLDIRPEHLLPGAVTLDGDEAGGDGAGT